MHILVFFPSHIVVHIQTHPCPSDRWFSTALEAHVTCLSKHVCFYQLLMNMHVKPLMTHSLAPRPPTSDHPAVRNAFLHPCEHVHVVRMIF